MVVISVKVKAHDGTELLLSVDDELPIGQLRQQIEALDGAPPLQQQCQWLLIFRNFALTADDGQRTLNACGIGDGAVLHVLAQPPAEESDHPSNQVQARQPQQQKSSAASLLEIHPDAVVVASAVLRGKITIGAGSIIHPQAIIDAGECAIVLGENNIVEETAHIQNRKPAGETMHIGSDNLFEIGSVCQAREVGDNNIFGIQCRIGPDVKITNGCQIGARCTLTSREQLPELTVLCFGNQRKCASEKPISPKSQAEFLKKLLPKYSEVIKNK